MLNKIIKYCNNFSLLAFLGYCLLYFVTYPLTIEFYNIVEGLK